MGLLSRLFGRGNRERERSKGKDDSPLSLQVVFKGELAVDGDALQRALRSYHPELNGASCEFNLEAAKGGLTIGEVRWGTHLIQVVGFNLPMPRDVMETCVEPSHYGQEL